MGRSNDQCAWKHLEDAKCLCDGVTDLSPQPTLARALFNLSSAMHVCEPQIFPGKQVWVGAKGRKEWAGREGPPREGTKEKREALGASWVSAAVHCAPGPGDLEAVFEANCMLQPDCVCHPLPPPPGSWPLRRPLFLSLCQQAEDTCGDRCTIWQQGDKFQESRGLNAQS